MVLNTLAASSDLLLQDELSFQEVVKEVATPGGITMEGTKIIYEQFPAIVNAIYEATLAKGKATAAKIRDNEKAA